MIRTESNGLQIYRFKNLLAEERLIHFVSTRRGGVSKPPYQELNLGFHVGDRGEDVLTNRRRLMGHVGIPLEWAVIGKQVHAGNVKVVTSSVRGSGAFSQDTATPGVDGLITDEPDVCLVVMQADCVPIVLYDRKRHIAGLAHSGWKGTVLGVTKNTVGKMIEVFGSKPEDIIAAIGPSIGPDKYEVGPEVVERARKVFPSIDVIKDAGSGKGLFDLWTANLHQLLEVGIPRENIEVARICTYTHSDTFYSERRERPTGRFAAAVMLME
jgi:YfiH family protein